jgi:major vault protein
MKLGPCDYIPPIEGTVIEQSRSFPLDKNEGIYVRDKKTGVVKMISG